jgi:CO/xanthine dehydrogenase FAD-binding subunit
MRVVGEAQSAFYEWLDPVDDVLGSAEYKVHLTVVLLRRALEAAAQRADGKADRA